MSVGEISSQNFEISDMSGLHPRIIAEQRQAELDILLPEINEEIEMWNMRLQMVRTDPEAHTALSNEAVHSLDSKWPFYGDVFLVSGNWYMPQVVIDGASLGWRYGEPSEVVCAVKSDGFRVDGPEDNPQVGYSFYIGEVPVRTGIARGDMSFYAFADPKQISLDYLRPQELKNSQMVQRSAETIAHSDSLLRLYMQNSNSSFFRSSHRKQQMFVENVLSTANEIMTTPGFRTEAWVTTPFVYIRHNDASSGFKKVEPSAANSRLIFSGQLDAVTLLEEGLIQQRPLRNKNDLIDPDAGLCLVLKIQDEEMVATLQTTHVFVPARHIDQLELVEG